MSKFKPIDVEKYEKPSKFAKWQEGDNQIRILRDPLQFYMVGKRTAKGFVRHIISDDSETPEFLKDVDPKLVYGFVLWNHDHNRFEVSETGIMLGDALVKLMKEKYPEEYKATDIIVNKKKTGKHQFNVEYTARWAKETKPLPKGVSQDSPEFKYILKHFQEDK